ncbi:ribonuclease P protein component, partial [Oleiphilus sp. HI0123]
MYSSFKFPKSTRLLKSSDYSDVFESVDIRVSSKHYLMLTRNLNNSDSRLGIIVAKKNVKLAVQRNRIKRLLRESFRTKRSSLPNLDIIVLAKKGADLSSSKECTQELDYLW